MAKKKKNYYNSSMYDEAIRSVRTNIQFSGVDKENKIISVTSTKPAEGSLQLFIIWPSLLQKMVIVLFFLTVTLGVHLLARLLG